MSPTEKPTTITAKTASAINATSSTVLLRPPRQPLPRRRGSALRGSRAGSRRSSPQRPGRRVAPRNPHAFSIVDEVAIPTAAPPGATVEAVEAAARAVQVPQVRKRRHPRGRVCPDIEQDGAHEHREPLPRHALDDSQTSRSPTIFGSANANTDGDHDDQRRDHSDPAPSLCASASAPRRARRGRLVFGGLSRVRPGSRLTSSGRY